MTLFPKLKGLYGNMNYGSDWEKEWANEKRVSSKDYFDRYFSYAIPERDVSDQEIMELIRLCANANIEGAKDKLKDLLTDWNAEKVVRKLRYMEKKLSSIVSVNLGKVLAISGSEFPNPDILFSFTMPFTQACILISHLAKNIPEGEARLLYGKTVISLSSPLPFAVECLRWFHTSKEKADAERIFMEDEEQILGKMVVDRIVDESKEGPIFIKYKGDAPFLLWTWAHWRSMEETEAHIIESIEKKPERLTDLLGAFVGTSWEMTTGLSRKGDFERENYNALGKLVDPEVIYNFIRTIYGPEVDNARGERFEYGDKPFPEKLAMQFASIHHYVKAEKENSELVPVEPGENDND